MVKYVNLLVSLVVTLCFSSCNLSGVVDDSGGSAEYLINNQSDYDLNIIFTTTYQLGMKTDSSKVVLSQVSTLLLKDGIIGVNPRPEDSIDSIRLITIIDEEPKVVFESVPVMNDDWKVLSQNFGSSGYGNTVYELLVENDDLNID